MELASFWLTFENNTVQMRGGHRRTQDDVVITWTAPRPLDWVRFLAVGVQYNADDAPHTFSVYRHVGWCSSFQTRQLC